MKDTLNKIAGIYEEQNKFRELRSSLRQSGDAFLDEIHTSLGKADFLHPDSQNYFEIFSMKSNFFDEKYFDEKYIHRFWFRQDGPEYNPKINNFYISSSPRKLKIRQDEKTIMDSDFNGDYPITSKKSFWGNQFETLMGTKSLAVLRGIQDAVLYNRSKINLIELLEEKNDVIFTLDNVRFYVSLPNKDKPFRNNLEISNDHKSILDINGAKLKIPAIFFYKNITESNESTFIIRTIYNIAAQKSIKKKK